MVAAAWADILYSTQYTQPREQDSVYQSPNAIDPAPRETDAARYGIALTEIMQRTYDVSGQKSEWILGTSILGNPELDAMAMGMSSISRRYPSKLAGLFTTRLGYDGSTVSLNGENGILFEEHKGSPVDTPITDLNWERPAFSGNALRLDFRRLITDNVVFELGLSSHSNVDSKEYSYQNVTHSPYFSLGRDSTQIPFGGRNIAMNSMHIQPMLTWRFGHGKAYAKMNYFNLENADNTNHKVLGDTLDPSVRKFQTVPYIIDIDASTYGAGIEIYPTRKLILGADVSYGNHTIVQDSLPTFVKGTEEHTDSLGFTRTDTTYYDSLTETNYESILGGFNIGYRTFLNPFIKFNYEFTNAKKWGDDQITHKYFQDREIGYTQFSDTLFNMFWFRFQSGLQRNSSVRDQIDYAKAYSIDGQIMFPFHLSLGGSFKHDNKFPDVSQLKFNETGRLSFARKDLETEVRNRTTINFNYTQKEVFYGIGFRKEHVDDLIKPRWVKHGIEDSTTAIEDAFRWTNISHIQTLDWILQVGFRLWNWKFYLERGETLNRSFKLMDTPELYYKGSIHWQNRFVYDRLGVSIRVDWQWFQDRYDCTINEDGFLELEEMKKYLALDFEARMQILQFELYTRIENFNHSIYMPESGYTPEGLRFAYGIVWTFRN